MIAPTDNLESLASFGLHPFVPNVGVEVEQCRVVELKGQVVLFRHNVSRDSLFLCTLCAWRREDHR